MRKTLSFLALVAVLMSGCNFAAPATNPAQETPTPETTTVSPTETMTEVPTALPPTPTEEPPSPTPELLTPGATATFTIFPTLTIATDTICRMGPEKHYNFVTRVSKGQSFEVSGRNEDSSWVSIAASRIGDDCWVPVSSLESPGDLSALNVRYTQPLPDEPMNVRASDNACGVNHLWLYWQTVNAVGYRIYRNGKEIATVHDDQYRDLSTPRPKLATVYLYEVESYNASGVSPRVGISVTLCG